MESSISRSAWALALANMLKTMIGSGVLTLPWATAQVGLALSAGGLLVLAFLSAHAIRLTVRCAACEPQERRSRLETLRTTGQVLKLASGMAVIVYLRPKIDDSRCGRTRTHMAREW